MKNIGARLLYAYGLLARPHQSSGAPPGDAAGKNALAGYKMPQATDVSPEYTETRVRRDLPLTGEGPDPHTAEDIRAARYIEQRNKGWSNNKPIIDLRRQNENIARLLDKLSGHAMATGNPQLPPAMNLVAQTARFLIATPDGRARIAYVLLLDSGLYGASPGERLTRNAMSKVVSDWMAENIFGADIESFMARKMLGLLASGARDPAFGSAGLNMEAGRGVINSMLALFNGDGAASAGSAATGESPCYRYLIDHIVAPVLPTLFFFREDIPPHALVFGTLDWCYLHIGLTFAAKSTVDIGDMAAAEVIEIGCTLSALMMMGSLSAGLIDLFTFPALMHYLSARLDEDRDAARRIDVRAAATQQDALMLFFSSGKAREKAVNPFKQFGDAISGYKSRTELAGDLLTKHCGGLTKDESARRVAVYKSYPGGYACPPGAASRQSAKSLENLPDLNKIFAAQNQDIADKFAIIDRLLILDAVTSLPAPELQFFTMSTIRRAGADFSELNPQTGLPVEYFIVGAKPAVPLLPGIELLLAASNGEERIFALGRDESGYWIRRIDRDKQNYYSLMKKNLAGADKNYRLNIYAGENAQGLYKTPEETLAAVSERLVKQHRKKLAAQLYTRGYEETTHEAFRRFLLSFIPFYHCVEWNPHRQEEALISCVVDGLNFIPLAGQSAALSSRILTKAGMGGLASMRVGMAGFAGGNSLKIAMGAGLRSFANVAMATLAEELDRKALTSMLLALARSLDPGIEMAGMLGKASVLQVRLAAKLLRGHSPTMEKLMLKLDGSALSDALPAGIEHFETGRLAGFERDIPIVRLGGDRYLGQPVYVRINPQTGDRFGIKYILAQGNRLEAVPVAAATRLKNILHTGLSGRGAGRAARLWNQQASVDTLVTHSLYGVECTAHISRYGDPGSEALLFPEMGIPLTQAPLDYAQYQAVYQTLSVSQTIALHLWSLEANGIKIYKYNNLLLDLTGFSRAKSSINENLWHQVPLERWAQTDRLLYEDLTGALQHPFPRQEGSYLAVGQYPATESIPWADIIAPGDIVTNYPTFLTVAPGDNFAKLLTASADRQGLAGDQRRQAIVYYKIENARQAIPLVIRGDNNQMVGLEHIYQPDRFFRVKSISTAYLIEGQIHPSRRIGVVLDELIGPVNEAKSMFTGENVPVASMEWANIVKRYHKPLLSI
ncbi:hypothetical protein ACL2XG_04970 [Sodalis sp. RH24]|uniref:hypothetical protein n=1 Tax=unclassified Sodalis (in: enterobacteria) TaxID=2636512 RepID=UPI0039B6A82F